MGFGFTVSTCKCICASRSLAGLLISFGHGIAWSSFIFTWFPRTVTTQGLHWIGFICCIPFINWVTSCCKYMWIRNILGSENILAQFFLLAVTLLTALFKWVQSFSFKGKLAFLSPAIVLWRGLWYSQQNAKEGKEKLHQPQKRECHIYLLIV